MAVRPRDEMREGKRRMGGRLRETTPCESTSLVGIETAEHLL